MERNAMNTRTVGWNMAIVSVAALSLVVSGLALMYFAVMPLLPLAPRHAATTSLWLGLLSGAFSCALAGVFLGLVIQELVNGRPRLSLTQWVRAQRAQRMVDARRQEMMEQKGRATATFVESESRSVPSTR